MHTIFPTYLFGVTETVSEEEKSFQVIIGHQFALGLFIQTCGQNIRTRK